jgi:hypothetical protein
MPSIPPAPDSASRRRRLPRRPTILLTMIVVALIAVGLGVMRAWMGARARLVRLEQLRAELAGTEARVAWSLKMQPQGYVPSAQAEADRRALERAWAELKAFEGR